MPNDAVSSSTSNVEQILADLAALDNRDLSRIHNRISEIRAFRELIERGLAVGSWVTIAQSKTVQKVTLIKNMRVFVEGDVSGSGYPSTTVELA